MNFLDVVDVLSNLLTISEYNQTAKKKAKIRIVFSFLILITAIWLSFELHRIIDLFSPLLFTTLFISIGFVFSIGVVILLYKLDWIEVISKKDYFLILITTWLFMISAGSFVNRKYSVSSYTYQPYLVIQVPEILTNESKVFIALDGNKIHVDVPVSTGKSLQKGDTIEIKKATGFLGFDFIEHLRIAE